MRIFNQLSVRLFLLLFISMAVVFGIFVYLNIHLQKKHLLECATVSGARTSDLVVSALRHSMLQNNRIEIFHAIQAIGSEKEILGLRIINKSGEITFSSVPDETGNKVDMSAEACLTCHSKSRPLSEVTDYGRTRIFMSPQHEKILGIISPIRNAPECSNAACHAHSPNLTILGVLDLKMSLRRADTYVAETTRNSILYGIFSIFTFALLFGIFIYQVVQKPIAKLRQGTQEISKGNLDYRIDIDHGDEIGQLARSFNYMTGELKKARDEITAWNRELEARVERKRRKLQQAEERMREIDKLASLGKLAASVAHELNNPLAGILTYSKLVERKLVPQKDQLDSELFRILHIIQEETARSGQIVKDLLLFARREGGEFQKASLHSLIEKSLNIVWHKITMQEIAVEKKFDLRDDLIECDPAQIQQALVALLVNATEAMLEGGTLTLVTRALNAQHVAVEVTDTGVGIPPEVKAHIFEPFFSTKENQKGVGLGLSVVFGIIQRHKGVITVESEVGKGTTFHITLPREQSKTD
ncbi:MAG: HAMP domain-containing protein [Calditrichaeota bacterium]|nr:MAG: HAMP domain-containing protein [Calditrichota bacterium]